VPPVGSTEIADSLSASFSLTYLLRVSDELYQGSNRIANPTDVSTTFQGVELSAAWNVSDNLVLSGILPWYSAEREESGSENASFSGLGDATVFLLWTPWAESEELSGLVLSMGLVLPTGEDRAQPLAGFAAPSVFQAGTGTFQATLGAGYSKAFGEWSLGGNLDVTFPLHESSQNFRPATTYYLSLFTGYAINEKLKAKLSAEVLHGTRDEFLGQDIENTGSTTVFLKPSLVWDYNEQLSASVSVLIPIWREVNRTQIAVGPLWSIGMSYSF